MHSHRITNLHFHLSVEILYVCAIAFKHFKYNKEYYQICDFCISDRSMKYGYVNHIYFMTNKQENAIERKLQTWVFQE